MSVSIEYQHSRTPKASPPPNMGWTEDYSACVEKVVSDAEKIDKTADQSQETAGPTSEKNDQAFETAAATKVIVSSTVKDTTAARTPEAAEDVPSATPNTFQRSQLPCYHKPEFKLRKHRWVSDRFEHLAVSGMQQEVWVDEYTLHARCPQALRNYWGKTKRGFRPPNPKTGCQVFNAYSIVGDREDGREVLVQWVAYEEQTWEPTRIMQEASREMVKNYFEQKRGSAGITQSNRID